MSGADWKDITDLVKQAASEMTNKEPMIHTSDFSLYDTMQAVEIMDPIMDQCCIVRDGLDLKKALSKLESSVFEAVHAVKTVQILVMYESAYLDGANVLECVKKCLFCWESAWKAYNVEDKTDVYRAVTQAYAKSLLLSLLHYYQGVMAADVYEEEDFQAQNVHLLYEHALPEDLVTEELNQSITALESLVGSEAASAESNSADAYLLRLLKLRRQLQSSHKKLGAWMHNSVSEATRMHKSMEALNQAKVAAEAHAKEVTAAEGATSAGPDKSTVFNAKAEEAMRNAARELRARAAKGSVEVSVSVSATVAALKHLKDWHSAQAANEAKSQDSSVDTTISPAVSLFAPITHLRDCPAAALVRGVAFNEDVVKLYSAGPQRKVHIRNFSDSLQHLITVNEHVLKVHELAGEFLTLPLHETAIAQATAEKSTDQAPDISVRPLQPANALTLDRAFQIALHISNLQLTLQARCYGSILARCLQPHIRPIVTASMLAHGLPRSLVEGTLCYEQWLVGYPTHAAFDSLKYVIGMNQAKYFALRSSFLLDLWNNVSSEATFIDGRYIHELTEYQYLHEPEVKGGSKGDNEGKYLRIQQSYQPWQWTSYWSLHFTLQLMHHHMSLLMSLDLVEPDEYDYFYWYWDYLYSTSIMTLEKMRQLRYHIEGETFMQKRTELELWTKQNSAGGGGKTKKGSKSKSGDAAATVPGPPPVVPPMPLLPPPLIEETIMRGQGFLCRGLYRLCAFASSETVAFPPSQQQQQNNKGKKAAIKLQRGLGLIGPKVSLSAFTTRDQVFAHRFQHFFQMTNPPALGYGDFLRATGKDPEQEQDEQREQQKTKKEGDSETAAAVTYDWAFFSNILDGGLVAFQQAKKCFDEVRAEVQQPGGGASNSASTAFTAYKHDIRFQAESLTALTKTAVASTLQTMKVNGVVKQLANKTGTTTPSVPPGKVNVNRTYHKGFPVLEFS